MTADEEQALFGSLRQIVDGVAAGRWTQLAELKLLDDASASSQRNLRRAVEEFPVRLGAVSDKTIRDAIAAAGRPTWERDHWCVYVPLGERNEPTSDLTTEIHVRRSGDTGLSCKLFDIEVR